MARMGKMIEKEIDSHFLDEAISVKIYLPQELDPIYENNICYMQDGDDYFQMGRVATVSDRLHEEDVLVNTILVGIHYIDRQDRLKKYYPDGESYLAYQQFLTEEVIPLVDNLIPINPLGTIRTLIGDSLAGTFALLTAIDYPKLFQKVIMQSPLVDEPVFEAIHNAEAIHRLGIYHSFGLSETAVWTTINPEMDFTVPNQQLVKLLSEKCPNYEYREIEKGNHTWKYWQRELPEVLEKMLS